MNFDNALLLMPSHIVVAFLLSFLKLLPMVTHPSILAE